MPRAVQVWLSAVCGLVQFIGVLFSLCSIDGQGRRTTALRSSLLVCVALIALSVSFAACGTASDWDVSTATNRLEVDTPADACNSLIVSFIMLYLLAYGSGLSGVASVVCSEIYPLRVRATGMSQAIFINWLVNYAVAQSFLSMFEGIGGGGTFGFYAAISAIGGVLLYKYLPETANVKLEQIETLFHDPYPSFSPKLVHGGPLAGLFGKPAPPPKTEASKLLDEPLRGGYS